MVLSAVSDACVDDISTTRKLAVAGESCVGAEEICDRALRGHRCLPYEQ